LQIPNTDYAVVLVGPDNKGHYRYRVLEKHTIVVDRFLGPTHVDEKSVWSIEETENMVYTLKFGKKEYSARVKLDLLKRCVVNDINGANASMEAFGKQK
jgi:hypothetical protein